MRRDPWDEFPVANESHGGQRLAQPQVVPETPQTQGQPAPAQGQGEWGDFPTVAGGNLEGDIGFADQSAADANSRPPQSDAYQQAMWAGLKDGSIRTPADANQLAAKYGLQIPDQAALAKAFQGTITGVDPAQYPTRPVSELRQDNILTEGWDAAARGVAGSVGLDDEIDAIVTSAVQGGDFRQNLNDARAIRDYDEENNFWPRLSGQVAGGLAMGAGIPSRAREVAQLAARGVIRSGGTRAEALAAARRAITIRSAKEGAGFGAMGGFWETDGNFGERALGGVGGALAGGAAGGVVGGAASQFNRLASRSAADRWASRPPPTDGQEVGAAADRLSNWLQDGGPFDVLPADVGGATTRRLTSAAAQGPVSAQPIVAAAQRVNDNARTVRDNVAASVGQALRPEAAGQHARQGATAWMAESGGRVRSLYRAAETAAEGASVQPVSALDALDRNIAELAETPGGAPGLEYLQSLRDELAQGPVSVAGLLRMRSVMRDRFIKDGLRGSDTERRIGQVLDAAQEDVSEGLAEQGLPQAARLYQQAAAAHRERINTIDNVLTPLIGTREKPKSGEQIIKTLTADLQGNNARAVRFLNSLTPEEQASTRASIIGQLGRSSKGQQNAEGDAFSLGAFLTHWNEIGETAKRAYFGVEQRAALNDLARVAQGSKEAQRYANHSNTSGGIAGQLLLTGGLGAAGGWVGLLAGSISQYGAGRLLASPRFARWLARAPRTQLSGPAYVDRLTRIARAEPAIAGDVISLQRQLESAFSGSGARLAAEQDQQKPSGVVGQNNEGAERTREPEPTPMVPGNIDLNNRPIVRNRDGSISTVRSMSFGTDQGEVLVPTVSDDGRLLSDEQAIQLYRRTGRHLGIFTTPDEATAYARRLHDQQERRYARP